MPRFTKYCLALPVSLVAFAAMAQESPPVYDRIDLNVSAERQVENDIMVAVVFAEAEANTQARAADEVNQAIRFAADRARATAGIEQRTLRYSTRPVYANDRRIIGWVARQSLRLESKDAAVLSTLLGELQTRVAIESMGSTLSKPARDAVEDEVIAEAIAQFRRRAAHIAAEFDRDSYRLVHLNVGSYGVFAQEAQMRALDAVGVSDAVAAPTIEAGVQTVSVQVNGTIELDSEP
jgi:predicted secreted protein